MAQPSYAPKKHPGESRADFQKRFYSAQRKWAESGKSEAQRDMATKISKKLMAKRMDAVQASSRGARARADLKTASAKASAAVSGRSGGSWPAPKQITRGYSPSETAAQSRSKDLAARKAASGSGVAKSGSNGKKKKGQ